MPQELAGAIVLGFEITKKFGLPAAFLLGIVARFLVMTVSKFYVDYFRLMPVPLAYKEIPLIHLLLTESSMSSKDA